MLALAKEHGVVLNKKSKFWDVRGADQSKSFQFGRKNFVEATSALKQAIAEMKTLKLLEQRVTTENWSKKKCLEYMASHEITPQRRQDAVQTMRNRVAAHIWMHDLKDQVWKNWKPEQVAEKAQSCGQKHPAGPLPPDIESKPKSQKTTESASGAGSSKDKVSTEQKQKQERLFQGSEEDVTKDNGLVQDITSELFRSKTGAVSEITEQGGEVNGKTEIIIPRVTLVKYLETINLEADDEHHKVIGYLLGAKLDKGKNKGRMLIRSLFVGDIRSENSINNAEQEEWRALHPHTRLIGRPGRLYIYIIYINMYI